MNQFAKVYLSLTIVTSACSGLSLAFIAMAEKEQPGSMRNAVAHFLAKNSSQNMEQIDESFELNQDFDHASIESVLGDIEVVPVNDGMKPRLRFTGGVSKDEIKPFGYKIEKRTLKVEVKKASSWHFIINGEDLADRTEGIKVTLEIPKSWTGSLTLTTVNDDITVGGFNLDELRLKTVTGMIETLGAIKAKHLEANTVSGEIDLEGHFRNVNARSVSGDVSLRVPISGSWNFKISTVSGEVENDLPAKTGGKDGTINMRTVSGSVRITPLERKTEEKSE